MTLTKCQNATIEANKRCFVNNLDNGAIRVHWPRSDVFVHAIFNISVVFLQPPATRIRWICSSSVRRSIHGLNRLSCIGESVRHRHGCPAWLASPFKSSAHFPAVPPTTRTASGSCFTHKADAPCRGFGILGRAVQLQNDNA